MDLFLEAEEVAGGAREPSFDIAFWLWGRERGGGRDKMGKKDKEVYRGEGE